MHELILGGGKSGKSRCAELRAKDWLQVSGQRALLIATATPGDDEMRERIARHREQRALHVPDLQTLEVSDDLPAALREWCAPQRLVIVDCLTVWLTQRLMPMVGPRLDEPTWLQQQADLCDALRNAMGPVVLVSNEIGMGVAPLGSEVRRYLDALGTLHQLVATFCERVTLMVAGIEMKVKE
ncbi:MULTISPECIES: bifunctional adenosylcobinamide kinase/adenosylcobinamide-phosphate guanylyltransferase [unclassified Methylibium]|uniref:bifunctional adenosylcobinamide kinase/adenosylcobinamide-phosphate guanylyltransferase n=1 Tax=unclassified Methylibium TaxID=2633235 RepID=UPI0003F46CD4|nr:MULTISPECIES: bifunctional adenosylcobinamide kinase/adenosylcobinamide-phosphate guanylyltransferase [unclassified Methylibium]MBI5270814.1 bifunctional adenosylcobinamide kinase/adenosylcobinamide-phosphate guanylyltransferase [Burkholderiales bacterium]AIA99048.1 Adenosylcobinamide kinase [Methylibium sp. T29]AIA99140.1 Adenosylcobinamide kinase [Methylibium sp. T29-B]EWS56366.1 Adenosylcobinamide kinase [Methylibium sp. T29]EWS60878.1 Adenosylcobinamide kinase [Methylibium sp. T29-B]